MTRLARPRSRPHGGGPPALGQRQRQRDRRKRQHRDGVHDYHEIFAVPGLSERIFHDHLECRSPAEVAGLLGRQVASDGVHPVDTTAFRWLIADLARSGALEVCDRERYRHRLSIHREPLDYVAVVGRKRRHASRFHRVTSRDRRGPDRRANAPSACKRLHNGAVRSSSVTLRDVARAAQVHPGTVSRALNVETRGLVNQETAERVIRAAEELGYRPNPIARGLKTNRSFTVGVLLPDLTNPLFPPIVRGIEDRLGAAGYTSLIANTDNDPDRERQDFEAMRARQVDGFITATARLDREFVSETAGLSEPIVLVNRRLEDESLPAVTVDDREGARLAVEHVVALGHRRVAHLGGPQALSTGHQRYLGFVAAMKAAGVEVDARTTRFAHAFTEAAGARVCRELLDEAPDVTAIVAANDLLALGCYDVLAERGLRCPDDVSVVGFNDMPFADRFDPPLTTVRIPHREIGSAAADLLLERLADVAGTAAPQIRLSPTFVARGSTAPPR